MSRPPHGSTPDARAGFTIVEVVLAMFILLIGMTSILGLLSFGAAMSRTATLRGEAAIAIDAVVADLEATLFPLVLVDGREVAGEPVDVVDRPLPGFDRLVYSATATPHPEAVHDPPLEYKVDVEVAWDSGGKRRGKTFTILLLREVPFGERLRQRFVEGLEPEEVDPDGRP